MAEQVAAVLNNGWKTVYHDDDICWPTGRENPAEIKLERSLSGRLKAMGYRLIADRTTFTDPHFRGGYQIVSSDTILAGLNFDLSLVDVADWTAKREQKRKRKRA